MAKTYSPEMIALKNKILECLSEHYRNYSKVAKIVGLTRDELFCIRSEFLDEFNAVESETYDTMVELCHKKALGLDLPEEHRKFDFAKGMKLLEKARREDWGNSVKVEKAEVPRKPRASARVDKVLENKLGIKPDDKRDSKTVHNADWKH